jgi:hypothetical protein
MAALKSTKGCDVDAGANASFHPQCGNQNKSSDVCCVLTIRNWTLEGIIIILFLAMSTLKIKTLADSIDFFLKKIATQSYNITIGGDS